ncbi:hypothetical protein HOLleu_26841 [Holothuria leucospilota]|uniref:RING-type domain-containing protein n=1 Tax=Holothuria leucospilota TaxID=206669 RepID=A0A9Q1BPI5_HOLLE|nr:hypothetical protein HOLleu_26841 [Holothuria leucospilota]
MDKDNANTCSETKVCCVCKEKQSRKKCFPCGHNICCAPCLENFKPLYNPDNPHCPLCDCRGTQRHFARYMTTVDHAAIDTMPRRSAPLPPPSEDDQRYCTPSKNTREDDKCQCRKVSVRIFCKGACYKCEGNSLVRVDGKDCATNDADPDERTFSEKLKDLRGWEQSMPAKIQASREAFTKVMNNVREDIKDAARAFHERLVEEENALLQELGEIASASCKYYMTLYDDYDELLVKEYELLDKVNEWKRGKKGNENKSDSISLRIIETSLNELVTKMNSLETQTKRRKCALKFHKHSPEKCLLGKLNQKPNVYETSGKASKDVLKTFHAKKKQDVFLHKFCIGVIWLNDSKCVAVVDTTSSDKCITFQIMSYDKENTVIHPSPGKIERRPGRAIHVCSTVGPDGESILISIGKEVLRIRLEGFAGKDLSVVSTTLQKPVQAVCWAQKLTQYFILTYQPWNIFLVDDKNSYSLFRSLSSAWYGPFIYAIDSSVAVGDISKYVFKIYDQKNVNAPVQVCPSRGLETVSPAAVCFNDDMSEWLFLWKSVSGNTDNERKWFITRHNQSFEFCGLALSGNLDKSDPRAFSVRNNKLVMLYHSGNIAIFQINSFSITST